MELSAAQAAQRIESLRATLAEHDRRYFTDAQPIIADAEYDALKRELIDLETAFPSLRSPDSPTARVGGEPDVGFPPIAHAAPMLSLDNVFSPEELHAWSRRVQEAAGALPRLTCEPKMDGVAVSLVYEDGIFVRGGTRGDGLVGEELGANLRGVGGVPARLDGEAPRRCEIRGEVFMSDAAFARLNESSPRRKFANPRNAAAGSLRQRDPSLSHARGLAFVAWGTGSVEPRGARTHADEMAWLQRLGVPIVSPLRTVDSVEEALAYVRELEQQRHALGFAIDGVVIKVDALGLRDELGATARAPRWATAYKFAAEERTTRLRRIMVHTGRSGKVTPFAVLDPIFVGGATVSLANLNNQDDVARKDLRERDLVFVRRAGDVRPEVVAPVLDARPPDSTPWQFPARCPSCDAELVRVAGEADWRCPNRRACPSQSIEWLMHFTELLEIDGIGYATAHALAEHGLVRDPGDLFALDGERLAALPNFKQRSIDKLLKAIDRGRDQPLWRLLVALNIHKVGPEKARILVRAFPSLAKLANASVEELSAAEGIGPTLAGAVREWFGAVENAELVAKLQRGGVRVEAEPGPQGPLAGKVVVLTGTLTSLSREAAQKRAEEAGAVVAGSVSKRVSFVVAGAEAGATKISRAQKLSIEIIDEPEFLRRLGAGVSSPHGASLA